MKNYETSIVTSKEISHLTGKKHKDVLNTLSIGLIGVGLNPQDFFTLPRTRNGKQRRVLVLPYKACLMSMLDGFTAVQLKTIVDIFARWHESDLVDVVPF